jgi:hypothetical protein
MGKPDAASIGSTVSLMASMTSPIAQTWSMVKNRTSQRVAEGRIEFA